MNSYIKSCCLMALLSLLASGTGSARSAAPTNFIKLSQDFLYAARTGAETRIYIDSLANAAEDDLALALYDDAHKKAFFINCYHAYTQALLRANPEYFNNRNKFFHRHQIYLAGNFMSLDHIANGLLRHSKVKWNYGYIGKLVPSKLERKFRVSKVDYRILFTLNCAARSCPPIAYYSPEHIEDELNLATSSYMRSESRYDSINNTLHVPAQMKWYRADFGGKKGERQICRDLGIIPQNAKPRIVYNSYDWDLYLDNYR